jgi:hypothetical protein
VESLVTRGNDFVLIVGGANPGMTASYFRAFRDFRELKNPSPDNL